MGFWDGYEAGKTGAKFVTKQGSGRNSRLVESSTSGFWGGYTQRSPEEIKKMDTFDRVSNKLNNLSKLKSQEQYNVLREARDAGLIDKATHLKLVDAVGNADQYKTQQDFEKSITPLERASMVAADMGKGVYEGTVGSVMTLTDAINKNINSQQYQGLQSAVNKDANFALKTIGERVASGKMSQAEGKKLSDEIMKTVNKTGSMSTKAIQDFSKLDNVKIAGAAGNTALNVLTMGGANVIKAGVAGVGKVGAKEVAKQVGAAAGKEALIGAGYGLATTAETLGKKATLEDYIRNTAMSTAVGGAIPIVSAGAKGVISKLKTNIVPDRVVQTIDAATGEKKYFTIPTKEFDKLNKAIDGIDGIAGKEINGVRTHITAKTPEVMAQKGFSYGGVYGAVAKPSFVEKALTGVGKQLRKTKVGSNILDVKDVVSQKMLNNLHFIEKPFIGKVDKITGRSVVDRIRELATNVRQAPGLALENRKNNKAWQELSAHIQANGGKKAMKEFRDFISLKQDAINQSRFSGKKVAIPKGTAQQEKAYKLLNQSTKDEVQKAFDAGLIDKTRYTGFMKDKNYTRVQRNLEDALNFPGQGRAEASISSTVLGQKLKGSSREAVDPLAAYIDWSNKITAQIERNKMATFVTDNLLEDKLAIMAKTGDKNTLARFRNGIKELVTTDPHIVDSIKNMDRIQFGGLQKYLEAPSMLLQRGATALNPAFAIPNMIRDEINSFILSKNPLATHNPLSIWQGIKEAIVKPSVNATARALKIARKGDDVWKPSKAFETYISRNAQMTTVDLTRNLKSATRQAAEEMGLKGESWVRKLESINSASEKMGRFQNFIGTYKKALKEGISDEEAINRGMQAARENGIDFSQRGEYATFARLFNPYFNASIQGSRSLARAIKQRPVATSIKIGATILMPIAGTTYYNLSDPKRAAIYANIPSYEREANLIFVLDNGQYIKAPLPPGVKEFGQPLRKLIESEYLGDPPGFLDTAKSLFIDAFNPLGPADVIPQAGKPVVENLANYSFFKQAPIVGENMTDLLPEDQVYKSTPQAYRDLGKALNMSPLKVQNLVKGYGAGGAEQLVSAIDALRSGQSPDKIMEQLTTDKRGTLGQIKGRFTGKVEEGSGEVTTKFYDAYQPLKARRNSASKKVTEAVKAGDEKKALKLIDAYNKTVDEQDKRFRTTYGTYEKDSELLDVLNKLKISKTPTALKSRLKD